MESDCNLALQSKPAQLDIYRSFSVAPRRSLRRTAPQYAANDRGSSLLSFIFLPKQQTVFLHAYRALHIPDPVGAPFIGEAREAARHAWCSSDRLQAARLNLRPGVDSGGAWSSRRRSVLRPPGPPRAVLHVRRGESLTSAQPPPPEPSTVF